VLLEFARSAASDLEDIVDWIAKDDPTSAKRVFDAIREAAGNLAAFPHVGHPGRIMGTRELVVAAYPYVIVYTADTRAVTVVAVFHAARDIAGELRRRGR